MNCRFCGRTLRHKFVDLISAPPSNSFLTFDQLNEPEIYYPLRVFVCDSCFLVQIDEYKKSGDIFDSRYAYFSSFSKTWLNHVEDYTEKMIDKFGFGKNSQIIEIASNDGYLLQYFHKRGIPSLGIEPAEGTADVAKRKGIETIVDFFGTGLAMRLTSEGRRADLLIGNNVLAHVPDINDFVQGLKTLLKKDGVITMEFPHIVRLIEENQFDTIYHEHYSYFSFTTVRDIFAAHGLTIYDVEELRTHGGSLRIYARHTGRTFPLVGSTVPALIEKENEVGIRNLIYYQHFQDRTSQVKYRLLDFLLQQKKRGRIVIGYGAAAKGNTLLNYCGIKEDLIPFIVDASSFKQGKYLPGSHIPVVDEEEIRKNKPAFVLILPWNIQEEIMAQLDYIRTWGGKFIIPIPSIRIVS